MPRDKIFTREVLCPVCRTNAPDWPAVDIETGWVFCGGCYSLARLSFIKLDKTWPNWLRAIAENAKAD